METTNLTLPTGTLVEIELNRWEREWRIPAIVVHADARGVGLVFRSALPELYQYETAAELVGRMSGALSAEWSRAIKILRRLMHGAEGAALFRPRRYARASETHGAYLRLRWI